MIKILWQCIRQAKTDNRGATAIEFAMIAPLLALLLVSIADLGLGIYYKMQVEHAARAGTQFAAIKGFEASSISAAVISATNFPGIAASPAPVQFCGCASSTGVSSAACNSTCVGGMRAATYVTASARGTYNTIFPYPMIPNSFAFSASSTTRIE